MDTKNKETMDMLHGPLVGKMLFFTLPIMCSGVLQLLFNAADIIVVGRFAGSNALAAVGSNGALINLIVNLLIGLSVGAAVTVGYYYGAGEFDQVRETIHTSIVISLIGGIFTGVLGFFVSPILLRWMAVPEDIIAQSSLYLRIYFIGIPVMSIYNFGSAMLRSLGDTKHPLYFLIVGGIINVILNVILVAVFHMDVAGVGIATVVSQAVSAILILYHLFTMPEELRLELKDLHISHSKLVRIMKIGVPAGIQSMIFSFSNVLIQSSVNSFGSVAVAGNSAAGNIEGFVYISMNAFHQSTQTFTSQNLGGRKFDRIPKILGRALLMVSATGIILGCGAFFLHDLLLGIYLPGNAAAISYGTNRMLCITIPYFLCGIMDVFAGSMRGMGNSVTPMLVSLVGSCLFRIIWIYTIFSYFHSLPVLYLSYPISWILTSCAHYYFYRRQIKKLTPIIAKPAADH